MVVEQLYIAGVLVSSALGAAVAVWLYTEDAALSTRLFVAMVALHSLVGLLVVGQLLAPESLAVPIYGIQKAAAAGIMPLWFLFALTFTRRQEGLPRPALAVIGGYYVAIALLEVTNPLHHLLWSRYELVGAHIPHLLGINTLVYTVVTLPIAVFYFTGLGLVGVEALSGPRVSRRQSAYLFIGYVPPFFVLAAGIFRVLPGPIDGGIVIVSTWSLAAIGWAVIRHRLFDLLPLARETVFEAVDDTVIVVDDDLRLLDYNDAATDAFGQLETAEGAALSDRLPGLLSDQRDDDPFADSFTVEDEDGLRHYDVTVSPLEVGGVTRGYGLVLRDVTERRRHVQELEQQTERLERFATTLSHDIRNPLGVAQGRVRVARETGDLDQLEDASRAHDRIAQITEDVLELAREGRRIEDPERVRVTDVLRAAWGTTDTEGASLEIDDGRDLFVYADPNRLQGAFENIIRNAVEHGRPRPDRADQRTNGRGHDRGDDVTITFGRHPTGFYIEDDGPGVPPEKRDVVFDYEFTTADAGTGLGLALVHEIARAHGWRLEMAAGRDGGARIVFSDVDPIDPDHVADD